jgi:hypothetical protein
MPGSLKQAIATAGGSSVSTLTATLGSGVTAGDFVIAMAQVTSGDTIAISDGSSDTYTDSGVGLFVGTVSNERVGAFFSPTAGVKTFTATFNAAASFSEMNAAEITGMTAPVTFDKVPAGDTGSSGTTISTNASGTLSTSADWVMCYMVSNAGADSTGQPSGWTAFNTANDNGIIYDALTSNASVTGTLTQDSGAWDGLLMTFQAASGAQVIGKLPSTLLLPPNRKMIGWRGLRRLQAYPPSAFTQALAGTCTIQMRAQSAAIGQTSAAATGSIKVKAQSTATGQAAAAARATIQLKGLAGTQAGAALAARGAIQLKARSAATGAASIAGRATIMLKAQSAATGAAALAARAAIMVKGAALASTGSFIALAGTCAIQFKAAAAALAAGALSATGSIKIKGSAAISGAVPLAGTAHIQVKSPSAVTPYAIMAGRAAIMLRAASASTSAAALSARATIMARASSAATGAASIVGQAAVLVKSFGSISTGGFIALSGTCSVMFRSAAQTAQAAAVVGYLTIQTRAKGPSSLFPPPAGTGFHYVQTGRAKIITPIGVS